MIAINPEDNRTIMLNRGDATDDFHKLAFHYPIWNYDTKQEEDYLFQLDDKISFVVSNKKGYTQEEIFRVEKTIREMGIEEPTYYPEIQLTEEDTKMFPLSNKRQTFWYDLILNDTTTMLGFMIDEDEKVGPSKIIVYPEREEI
jgi:hypothetical protein